ncbi:hypothetical protein D3C80_1248970 [compost metagenome]
MLSSAVRGKSVTQTQLSPARHIAITAGTSEPRYELPGLHASPMSNGFLMRAIAFNGR